jgi:hypothetical protein
MQLSQVLCCHSFPVDKVLKVCYIILFCGVALPSNFVTLLLNVITVHLSFDGPNGSIHRWRYKIDSAINKEAWSEQEELRLIRAHQIYGTKWREMVKHFPGR